MRLAVPVLSIAIALIGAANQSAAEGNPIPLVTIKSIDPTIVIDLRYGTSNNIARRSLYPRGMSAWIRPEVGPRLREAQKFLRRYNYKLKIWDAYRPHAIQKELWRVARNDNHLANPENGGGSMHSWGIAVDCTLVDLFNRPVSMPTDFDDFTPAAMSNYVGSDPAVRSHLHLLQIAMSASGFYGFSGEWWHFIVKDWPKYLPPEEVKRVERLFGSPANIVYD